MTPPAPSTAGVLFDLNLAVIVVVIAFGAVLARDLFAAVAGFIVLGLFVAVAWVRLGAVDVALAEAAIGAGLTGVLLVRALARLPVAAAAAPPPRAAAFGLLAAIPALVLFAVLAAVVLHEPAEPWAGLGTAVADHLPATGVGNPVTAVLLNFRGYDTLLETVVLLVTLLAVWSLCEDRGWDGTPGLREHARPAGVLVSFARLLPPMGLLVGLHLFWAGADAPGGAFQAATVLAAVWLLLAMAGMARPPAVTRAWLRLLMSAGPAAFLAVAALALPAGGLLVFPPALAKPLVLAVEATLTVSLAAILTLLVIGPPGQEAP